jgi:hypothetical protein
MTRAIQPWEHSKGAPDGPCEKASLGYWHVASKAPVSSLLLIARWPQPGGLTLVRNIHTAILFCLIASIKVASI